MDLLGVGPLELVFVLLIIFLVLGPDDLVATGRKIGRFLRTITRSETWLAVKKMGEELRSMPTKLMREAEIKSFLEENREKTIAPLRQSSGKESPAGKAPPEFSQGLKAWTTPPAPNQTELKSPQEETGGKEEG